MPRITGILELAKTAFLKTLIPYYVQAEGQDKLDQFFDTLISIWLDRYPINEFCDPFFQGDLDYHEWATAHIKAVSLAISCWNVCLHGICKDIRKQLRNMARWSTLRVSESSNWEDEVTVEKMGRISMVGRSYIYLISLLPSTYITHKEPPARPIILEDEELLHASESLIAYVEEGLDPGTPCGIPHISHSCPCTLNIL